MSRADVRTIGTTGMKPKMVVPPGVRVMISRPPPVAQATMLPPGAGAGILY